MAYQVGSVCYETASKAAEAQASAVVGSIVMQGGVPHTVSVTSVGDAVINYVLSPVGGGAALTHAAPFTPQPCNMLEGSDGMAMGWLVAAVWIGTYSVLFLTRALRGETGGNYGNA